jgi:hypothetical protein
MELAALSGNPAKFTLSFNDFKLFAIKYWSQIDYDLDLKTRKQIEMCFTIENSMSYLLFKFIAENLDFFFRFAYIACFLIYLMQRLSILFDLKWLYGLSIALFISSFFFWMLTIIWGKMIEEEMKFSLAFRHYATFECLFPRKNKMTLKVKER